MKLAFISDIHGNISALSAVLKDIIKLDIKRIYCLGDIVNYYYEADKCIELLMKYNVKSIRGNHEKILFETYKNKSKFDEYLKRYGNSVKINHSKLKKYHLTYLQSLKNQKIIQINKKKCFLLMVRHGKIIFTFILISKRNGSKKYLSINMMLSF